MKRVLLTGSFGYIGSHTAVVLAEAGFEVVLYDNLSNSKRSVLDRLETITGVRFPFVEGGVRDTAMVEGTLRAHQIEAVIHFAGLKAVGESVEQPLSYYDNKVVGALSLVRAMQSVGIHTLVFSSSAIAFGGMLLVVLYLMAQSGSFASALPLYAFAGYRLMPALQQIYGAVTQLRFAGPALDALHADLMSLQPALPTPAKTLSRSSRPSP